MVNDGLNCFDSFDPNYYPNDMDNMDSNEQNAHIAGTILASFVRDDDNMGSYS